jgi:hypothetical protein
VHNFFEPKSVGIRPSPCHPFGETSIKEKRRLQNTNAKKLLKRLLIAVIALAILAAAGIAALV